VIYCACAVPRVNSHSLVWQHHNDALVDNAMSFPPIARLGGKQDTSKYSFISPNIRKAGNDQLFFF
jgi:hypothetical protein